MYTLTYKRKSCYCYPI